MKNKSKLSNNKLIPDICRIIIDTSKNQSIDYTDENLLLAICCRYPKEQPREIAARYLKLYNQYNGSDSLDGYKVIDTLKICKLANVPERMKLFADVLNISGNIIKVLEGISPDINFLNAEKIDLDAHKQKRRLILLIIAESCNQIKKDTAYKYAMRMNKDFAGECLDAIISEIMLKHHKSDIEANENVLDVEEYQMEISRLTISLSRANNLLLKLQQSFEEQLAESKAEEQIRVISILNSDKYGCILDLLISAQSGFSKLRSKKADIPLEIKSVQTLVRRLLEFVEDCGIAPMLTVGEKMEITPSQIEGYTFFGKPFISEKEKKKVEVISSGWEIEDRDLVISYPKVKEIMEE